MVRGALWLLAEIGEGNVFTKEQVRQAFPGVSQADRRIRDLRNFGWVIHSSNDDATLLPEEQRFVRAGLEVWDPDQRRRAELTVVTAKQRMSALAADEYQCVVCGIAGGEVYPDSPNDTAVLSASRKTVRFIDGRTAEQLVTVCKRCRAGGTSGEVLDLHRLLSEIQNLDDNDKSRLRRWMERDRRGATPLDRVWTQYRRLPAEAREEVGRLTLE